MKEKKDWVYYVNSRNLINRVYDMLEYFNCTKCDLWNEIEVRNNIKDNIKDISYVETVIKYLYVKLKKKENRSKIILRSNITELINDLDSLKQYLDDEPFNKEYINQ